jgi:hypothetical protein
VHPQSAVTIVTITMKLLELPKGEGGRWTISQVINVSSIYAATRLILRAFLTCICVLKDRIYDISKEGIVNCCLQISNLV